MDFAFSPEQDELRASARAVLAERLSPERLAEIGASESGWDEGLWRELAELGWTGASIPEANGGAGMGFLDEAVLFEELGRALAPVPFFSTVALALPALSASEELLAGVVDGSVRATLAFAEPGGAASLAYAEAVKTEATEAGDRWTLSGEKTLVPDLGAATHVVVAARSGEGIGLWSVARSGTRPEARVLTTVDSTRRLGRLRLDRNEATLLVEPGAGEAVLAANRLRALSALALEAVGIADRAMTLAADYAKGREQFGRPIGAYQAVSHPIVDTYVETELARSLALWAAWCVAEDDEQTAIAVASAKAAAAEAAVAACERSIQVHGGIGFTWEHVLHRLYKRAEWIEAWEGFGATHRAAVAHALFDAAPLVATTNR